MKDKKTIDFINKANKVHNNFYDYSKTEYIKGIEKVCIICPEHGEFWQRAYDHLYGCGCKQCGIKRRVEKISKTEEEFINESRIVHSNKYDYSKVEYVNYAKKVCIICPEHGEFWQTPGNHLMGYECKQCAIKRITKKTTKTKEEFISDAIAIHGNDYDYSKVNYKNAKTKVCIICPEHGEFWQVPNSHLNGTGCPRCSHLVSSEENDLFLELKKTKPLQSDRKILDGREIDMFFEENKLGIEYNGLLWHTEKFGGKDKYYHLNKTVDCERQGVTLIHLYSDEYYNHKELVIDKIYNLLDVNRKKKFIDVDKCVIKTITNKDAKPFLNKFDLNANVKSDVNIGCYYRNKLVAVMSFFKRDGYVELCRLSYNIKYNCDNLLKRMLDYFINNNNNVSSIKCFCSRRWFNNLVENEYTKLGFKFVRYTEPTFDIISYSKKNKRFNKIPLTINDVIKDKNNGLSLMDSIVEHNYDVIWNCGCIEYELELCNH